MKKYVWLVCITAGVVSLTLLLGMTFRENTPVVATEELKWQQMEQTVQCSGKVEEASGDVLAVVADTGGRIQIRAAVPENRLKLISVGQRVRVSGAAFAADSYSGTVVTIGEKAYTGPTGGTMVDVVIALDSFDQSLKCGLSAKAGICVDTLEGVLIPYSSVTADENGQEYVYLLRDGCAVRQDIVAATELTEGVFVTDGLSAGDCLITQPEKVPAAGATVKAANNE